MRRYVSFLKWIRACLQGASPAFAALAALLMLSPPAFAGPGAALIIMNNAAQSGARAAQARKEQRGIVETIVDERAPLELPQGICGIYEQDGKLYGTYQCHVGDRR